uniref:Putative RING finger E3 ubiquitin ligase n=1 Tax=Pithovirus LCPAC001 TaxID=2506585 RepID=A0A481Z2J4_9VIRU|nr:MAG: putative RING finger E3 ubiquitin ligase [Pithovirus LCPAC001]
MECRGIVKSGPKKGEVCGRRVVIGSRELCGYHRKKIQKYKKIKRPRSSEVRGRHKTSRSGGVITNTSHIGVLESISEIPKVIVIDDPHTKTLGSSSSFTVLKDIIPCVICLENNHPNDSLVLGCKHQFHIDCIVQIRGNSCPMCRAKITSVPSYISTILKMNHDNDKKMKNMEEELRVHREQHSSPSVIGEAFLLLQRIVHQVSDLRGRTREDRSTRQLRSANRRSITS